MGGRVVPGHPLTQYDPRYARIQVPVFKKSVKRSIEQTNNRWYRTVDACKDDVERSSYVVKEVGLALNLLCRI